MKIKVFAYKPTYREEEIEDINNLSPIAKLIALQSIDFYMKRIQFGQWIDYPLLIDVEIELLQSFYAAAKISLLSLAIGDKDKNNDFYASINYDIIQIINRNIGKSFHGKFQESIAKLIDQKYNDIVTDVKVEGNLFTCKVKISEWLVRDLITNN